MPVRHSEAVWNGTLREGNGTLRVGDGKFEGPYSFVSRFEEGPGTNPEELIGAAHAGCFSMAFSGGLVKAGFQPNRIRTRAVVHLDRQGQGFGITRIDLETEADVPDIDDDRLRQEADTAKANCPVSRALAGVEITVKVTRG